MKKNRSKKYYMFDGKLNDEREDFFRHNDLSENICDLIENDNYNKPYNIALIGQWGIGKSSLLKFVTNKLSRDGYNNVYTINAWKYEKESIRIVLLKNIIKSVDNNMNAFSFILKLISNLNEKNKRDKEYSIREILKFINSIRNIIIILICVTILSGLAKMHLSTLGIIGTFEYYGLFDFIIKAFDYFVDNFLLNFVISIGMIIITDSFGVISKKLRTPLDIGPIVNDTCYYEEMLDKILAKKNKEKIIIILDDIDRLSREKIVETLDVLKILMDKPNLIFIVPFDDSIVKRALEKKTIDDIDPKHQFINSELILDKLFKFKFYLNPLIPYNINNYAIEIIKNDIPDIRDFIEDDEIAPLVKILIHKNVETPRQVKKIINIFMNNLIILDKRCGKNDVNGLLTFEGKKMLAKLSVLQADFNDFYDTLIINNDNINELLEYQENETTYDEVRNELKFLYDEETSKIKNEHLPLLNFLTNTREVNSSNISSYLYLNESPISLKYTSKTNKRLLDTIESNNYKSVCDLIDNENKDLSELIINIMDETDMDNMLSVINICIKLYSKYYKDNINYANSLSNLINKMYSSKKNINNFSEFMSSDIIGIYNNVDIKYINGINQLTYQYIKWLAENKNEHIYKNINCFLDNEKDFDKNTIDSIKKLILNVITDENISEEEFFENIKIPNYEKIRIYFGIEFLREIKKFYIENDNKEDFLKNWLTSILSALGGTTNLEVCKIIEELYENESNISILNKLTLN